MISFDKIEQLLEQKNSNVFQMMKSINSSSGSYNYWRKNGYIPSESKFTQIANFLSVSKESLICNETLSNNSHETKICDVCGKEFFPNKTRKYTCSKECSYKRKLASYKLLKSPLKKKCVSCGKEFITNKKRKITCSKTCSINHKKDSHKKIKTPFLKICEFCGKEYYTNRSKQKFCSQKCRINKYNNHSLVPKEKKEHLEKEIFSKVCVICKKVFETSKKRKITCSNECSAYYKKHRDKVLNEPKTYTFNCSICGKEFTTNSSNQKYCSVQCRNLNNNKYAHKYYDKHRTKLIKICPVCGKEFYYSIKHHKYCSDDCFNEMIKQKNALKEKNKITNYNKICSICGQAFITKFPTQKYCSDVCIKKSRVIKQTIYFNKKREKENTEKEKLIKDELLFKQQEKLNIYTSFCNGFKEHFNQYINYTDNDFNFTLVNENDWFVIIYDGCIRYNSKRMSNLVFTNKDDAIKYCFDIYNGNEDYIKLHNKYILSQEKIKLIKSFLITKLSFPQYMKESIIQYAKNDDYQTICNFIERFIERKLKLENISIDIDKVKKLYFKADFISEIEKYIIIFIIEYLRS